MNELQIAGLGLVSAVAALALLHGCVALSNKLLREYFDQDARDKIGIGCTGVILGIFLWVVGNCVK